MVLLQKTKQYILDQQLISAGDKVLAAVSAGKDSCVLLDILYRIQDDIGFELAVAHFDHQLRAESAAEGEFVEHLAARYGIKCYRGGDDIGRLAQGKNLQQVARQRRYAFLRSTADLIGANKIAVAHHALDQAETLLLHLLRGSGIEGLAAMSPEQEDIIRPLLTASPQEIEDYRATHNLLFCQDQSNFSEKYLRNKIRLRLIPELLTYNPNIVESFNITADICREDNNFLDELAEIEFAEIWIDQKMALSGAKFDRLPLSLKRRVLRKAYCLIAGESLELSYRQTSDMSKLKEEQSLSLPGGVIAYRREDIYFAKEKPPLPEHQQIIQLSLQNQFTALDDWGWSYTAVINDNKTDINSDSIRLPAELLADLYFRCRHEGDAVPSHGKNKKRKLKEIFIDAKIPPVQRANWPILLYKDQIIWIPFLYKNNNFTVLHNIDQNGLLLSLKKI